jgi:hypothetical protein
MSAEIKSLIQSLPISSSKAYGKALHEILIRLNTAVSGVGSYWTKTGNDVWNNTENIGIGTDTPGRTCHIKEEFLFQRMDADGHFIDYQIGNNVNFANYGAVAEGISRSYSDESYLNHWEESIYNDNATILSGDGSMLPSYQMRLLSNDRLTDQNVSVNNTGIFLKSENTDPTATSASFVEARKINAQIGMANITDGLFLTAQYALNGTMYLRATDISNDIEAELTYNSQGEVIFITNVLGQEGYYESKITSSLIKLADPTEEIQRYVSLGLGIQDTITNVNGSVAYRLISDRGDSFPGIQFAGIPEHADNAAAVLAGLTVGVLYTTAGTLKIVV